MVLINTPESMVKQQQAMNQSIIDSLVNPNRMYTAEEWRRKQWSDRQSYYAGNHCCCFDPETGESHEPTYEEWLEGKHAEEENWRKTHPKVEAPQFDEDTWLLMLIMLCKE